MNNLDQGFCVSVFFLVRGTGFKRLRAKMAIENFYIFHALKLLPPSVLQPATSQPRQYGVPGKSLCMCGKSVVDMDLDPF
jgi:hypothetical protein